MAIGAEDGIRTRDPHLGKVMRYRCATSALVRHSIAPGDVAMARAPRPGREDSPAANVPRHR
jgi:hypothetical protein